MREEAGIPCLSIRPKWWLSTSYEFYDHHSGKLGFINYPLMASLLNINSAVLIFRNEKYKIIDAVVAMEAPGMQRNVNTHLKKEDMKIVELIYPKFASNNEFTIFYEEANLNLNIKLTEKGIFEIFEDSEKIGHLENSDFFTRRSKFVLLKTLPLIVQAMIFWGSINRQNIV
jgi:hypothetical protein